MVRHTSAPQAPARELLSIDAACAYWGVSERYLRSLIASGELPAVRLPSTRTRGRGWVLRINRADMDALEQPVRSAKTANADPAAAKPARPAETAKDAEQAAS